MLKKEPNSNDNTRVENNVHLTTIGAQQFSIAAIEPSCRKADLLETRDNDTINKKGSCGQNKLCLGKEQRLCICLVV